MGQADEKCANEGLRGSVLPGASAGGEGQRGSNAAILYSSSTRQERLQNPGNNSPSSRMTLADHIQSSPDREFKAYVDANKNLPQRSSSPKRRSASPHRRVQIGRSGLRRPSPVVIRSINYFSSQDCSSRDKGITKGSDSSDTEDDANNVNPEETRSVRRLSVQDAISLFENKRRNSNEAPIKKPSKQESRRGSLESVDSSTSGKSVLRRWNTVNDICCELNIQQQKEIMLESQGPRGKSHSDGVKPPIEATVEGQHGLELNNKQETEGLRGFSDSNRTQNGGKVRQQSQPLSFIGTSAPPETSKQQFSVATESFRTLDGEWQKQFKMELARSLSREVGNGGAPNMTVPSKSEFDSAGLGPSTQNDSTMNNGDARIAVDQGGGSVVGTSDSAAAQEHENVGWRRMKQPELESTVLKERDSTSFKELSTIKDVHNFSATEVDSLIKAEETHGKESLSSSWNAPLDFDMQTLVNMADQQHASDQLGSGSGDEGSPSGQRGRFYEQYRKLRDAKLREEHVSKRAEREAKLKAMEETLERRKAELEARNVSLSTKKNTPVVKAQQLRAEKLQARKGDSLLPTMKEQEEEEGTDKDEFIAQARDGNNAYSSPTSPSSTPRAPKNHLPAPRPQDSNKKIVPSSQKSASTPRSSTRAPTSSSPRSTPKNPVRTPNQRKSAVSNQAGILDNPLARSVPCFADLRKENTKPSPGRVAGSARQPTKTRNYSGRPRTVSEAAPLELNGNISALSAIPPPSSGKEGKKPRSVLTRKSYATVSDLKALSVQGQEGTVLSPLKVQTEGTPEPAIYSKIRRSAVAPIQEVKPFLRKGHGIGPGAGPGVMKQKASAAADAAKSSDEETPATPSANLEAVDPENHEEGEAQGTVDSGDIPTVDDSEGGPGSEVDASSNFEAMNASDCQLSYLHSDLPRKSEIATSDVLSENVSINVETCHNISFPSDSLTQKHHTSFVENPGSLTEHSLADVALINQEDGQAPAPLAQILDQISTEPGQGEASSINTSSSFRASSLPHELITAPFSPAAASPSRSSVIRPGINSDHFSPPSVATLDSPLGSPASWNSSQIQYTSEADLPRSRKKWGGSQKPVLIINQPLKEPAKGLKRLLKFGRKSRTSETATTDWVSASTTSEGDDDTEEPKDPWTRSAELLRRAKIQERKIEFGNTGVSGEQYGTQDQGTIQSLRSSIPAPPANFKLREDHLYGGSLPKAPRSFFSLSSFRSRGSEGKSR